MKRSAWLGALLVLSPPATCLAQSTNPIFSEKLCAAQDRAPDSRIDGSWLINPATASLNGISALRIPRASNSTNVSQTITTAPVSDQVQTTGGAYPINESESRLSDAQRLTIKFEKYEKLSGDYRVSAENTISIPGLGLVSVGSITGSDLKHKLNELILKRGGTDADVSVEIAEYRPVFVTGLVRNSGSYPWKPGMIALHGETLSGGIGLSGGGAGGGNILASDNESIRQEKAESDLKRVLATLARLSAEKKDHPVIDVPARLAELAGQKEASELIGEQSSVLVTRRSSLEAQYNSLQQGEKMVRKELEGLRAQLTHIRERIVARREVRAQIEKLFEKKLVRNERVLEEQSAVADLEEKEANLSVGIIRSEGVLLGLERDIEGFKRQRMSEIDAEIFKLQREAAQLEIEIRGAVSAQRKLAQVEPTRAGKDGNESGVHYEIFRGAGDKAETIQADRFTSLRPGDVLVITASEPEPRFVWSHHPGASPTASSGKELSPTAPSGF